MGSTATPTKPITTTLSYQDIRQIHTGLTMEMTKAKRMTKTKTIVHNLTMKIDPLVDRDGHFSLRKYLLLSNFLVLFCVLMFIS